MNTLITTIAALPLLFGLYGSFENGATLDQIATNIANEVGVDSGMAFDLGGGRTVNDALDSCAFRYDNCRPF